MKVFLLLLAVVAVVAAESNNSSLRVNLTHPGQLIPKQLFGVFSEEANHAGAGGLWAELVSNRGFEANGTHSPPAPWGFIGNELDILISTDLSSPFKQNQVALRIQILRDTQDDVGVYNPGFWEMNIEKQRKYKVTFYLRSSDILSISVSFTGFNGTQILASKTMSSPSRFLNWTRMEVVLTTNQSNQDSRLQFTTNRKGLMWLDQVSAMPMDTYKGHGFRKDVFEMIAELKPGFLRIPGGTSVTGINLRNAFQWKKTIGPWEERPGHYGDSWSYWTDDGLGFFELLLLAEDLNAEPILVVNCGISDKEHVNTSDLHPYVQDMLNAVEFARGETTSTWGSVRDGIGRPKPFQLKYVTIGNENCESPFYEGNYMELYKALKQAHQDIQVISNCNNETLYLPADLMEYNRYSSAATMFTLSDTFDRIPRNEAKVFVSEYGGLDWDAGRGNLLIALAEAAFLMGVEKNSDIVAMACSPFILVNDNDRNWNSGTIVLNSYALYGTPKYWMQRVYFSYPNDAYYTSSVLESENDLLVASAISWRGVDGKKYTRIKVVNFGNTTVELTISFEVHQTREMVGLSKTVLGSSNKSDENSFQDPKKVYPVSGPFNGRGKAFNVSLSPYSLQLFDFSEEKIKRQEFKHLMERLKNLAYIIIFFILVGLGICRLFISAWGSSSNIQDELEMTDLG